MKWKPFTLQNLRTPFYIPTLFKKGAKHVNWTMLKVQASICPEKLAGDLILASNSSDYAPAIITFSPTTATHFKILENEIYYHVRFLDELECDWVRDASIKKIDCSQRIIKRKSSTKKHPPDDVHGKIWQLNRLNRRSRLGQVEKWNLKQKPKQSLVGSQDDVTCDDLCEKNGLTSHKRKTSGQCNGIKKCKEPTSEDMAEEIFFTPPSSLDEDDKTFSPAITTNELQTRTFQDGMCSICGLNSNDLVACEGDCCKLFHLHCLAIPEYCGNFICDECTVMAMQCFACKQSDGALKQCSVTHCNKLYHIDCLQQYSRIYDSDKKGLVCPRHKCARCLTAGNKKLVYCTRCPIALHDREGCLIAGCEVFTSNPKFMICYKHIERPASNKQLSCVNLTSCLHCGEGGLLSCCDFCSASYHAECLPEKYSANSNNWLCPDCTEYQNPTYGSVVWCKLGKFRWWPSLIFSPKIIPERLLKHKNYQGTFLVEFLGSGDHSWIHHGRCLPFTDESIARLTFYNKRIDLQFNEGYAIAVQLYEEAKAKLEKQLCRRPSKKFVYLKSNKYLVPSSSSLKEVWPCQCTEDHPCDLDSVCVNRATMTECVPDTCPVKQSCQNQRMQKQQYADTVTYFTKNTGWGLKATHDIKNGDFVIEYVGEVISKEMCDDRIKKAQEKGEKNFYMLTLEPGLVIDACYKANKARFINHSCDPNLETQVWTVDRKTCIGLFAIKDIPAGTELTFDYHLDCVGDVKSKCYCGTPTCVGFLGGKRSKMAEKQKHTVTTSKKRVQKPKREKKSRGEKKIQRKKMEPTTTPLPQISTHEDLCFWCGDGGELMMCDKKGCPKAYHIACLEIDGIPKGKWICPWHFCDECGKRSSKCCPSCPTSFCTQHGDGELLEKNGTHYCVDHIP